MIWTLHVAGPAAKALKRIPQKDVEHIRFALKSMQENPFAGDVVALKGQPTAFRRRVGNWRIFFDLYADQRFLVVTNIKRRTSTTY